MQPKGNLTQEIEISWVLQTKSISVMIWSMREELRFVFRVGSLFWIRYPRDSIVSQHLFFLDYCSKILRLKLPKIKFFEFLVRRKWSIDSKKFKNFQICWRRSAKKTDRAHHFIFVFDWQNSTFLIRFIIYQAIWNSFFQKNSNVAPLPTVLGPDTIFWNPCKQ